ncbi:unnamed protein product [Peronospora belbahrii]|nr:unnamed protein product [Peronospora belbahrii]
MQTDDAQHDDGVEAVKIMDEIATCQVDTSLHNKHKTVTGKTVAGPKVEKLKKNVEAAEKEGLVTQAVVSDNGGNELPKKLMTKPKKRKKKLRKQATEEAKDKKHVDDRVMHVDKDETNLSGSKNTGAALRENGSLTAAISTTPSSKSSAKRKNRSKVATTTSSVLPTVHASVQPSEDTALTVSSIPEKQLGSDAAKCVNKVVPKITEKVREKKAKTGSKSAAARSTKAGSNDEKNTAESPTSLTPIAASLVKAAKKKKNDMFLSKQEETSRQSPVSSKRIEKAAILQVADEVSSESEDDGKSDSDHSDGDKMSLFSRLIDSAAREQWQLVEVGRLVRLFAAEWDFKGSKTARFLCKTCPELVNVDFVEGLGVSLSAKQLVQVFEAGSGNSRVLMNKLASAVENGDLSVRDPAFVSALEQRVALMESNAEVMELLYPLLESLSTVRDVSYLIKQLCEHWQLERKIALVQQVLLSSVFDDLDGNQDDILLDLPDLTGRLDFPSRLDQEDVDENGNLKGFLANDDSDCDEEGELKEDIDADASEDDEDLHDDETDSEEEVEISGRSWGRNQFIEDEADVGDEDDDVDEEERLDDDASSSTNTD